jgi:hypothetical protein
MSILGELDRRLIERFDKEKVMRFISIWRPTGPKTPPPPTMAQEMGTFMAEAVSAGVLLATEGFGPSTKNDLIAKLHGGELSVTDGPFTEAKEVIGGFAILQVKSREELLHWTRRFLAIAGGGECEIHRLADESPLDQLKH